MSQHSELLPNDVVHSTLKPLRPTLVHTVDRPFILPIAVAWVLTVVAGLVVLFQYEFDGSVPLATIATWPDDALVSSASNRPTLIYYVHPNCPCTGAGLAELDRVLSDFPESMMTYIVLAVPSGAPSGWIEGRNANAARRIPNVKLVSDIDLGIAKQFGIESSGTALLYGADGALQYRGGLTASRGHEGVNSGSLAIRSVAQGEKPLHTSTPVFGCAIANRSEYTRNESDV